jgi:hypothetical protein
VGEAVIREAGRLTWQGKIIVDGDDTTEQQPSAVAEPAR